MENNQRLSTVFSLVMMVATATLGWMSLKNRDVPHVEDARLSSQVPPDEQNVVARLWEDPLQAVQAELLKRGQSKGATTTASAAPHDLPSMAASVFEKSATRKIQFLVVPLPDTPFPDDMEVRLRLRYAIQMALAEEKYAPDNRNYLGYFWFKGDPTRVDAGAPIPYEWFFPRSISGSSAGGPALLVLWLPESLLSRDPLGVLAALKAELSQRKDQAGIEEELDGEKFLGLSVIGPRTSDTLKKMVPGNEIDLDDQAKARLTAAVDLLRGKLAIFSPQSTTPDALLQLTPQSSWLDARKDLAQKFGTIFLGGSTVANKPGADPYFYNFIAPDDQLTDLLAVEMRLRGIEIAEPAPGKEPKDRILLLTEADTSYGRSLPIAFHASLDSLRHNGIGLYRDGTPTSTTPDLIRTYDADDSADPQLLIYRYLRGLDQKKGQDNEEKSSTKMPPKSPEEALSEALNRPAAMAIGESQRDYADRLADEIKRGDEAGKVKAVGVLGGDLYDKLILLRALRGKFPDALFFTTDLDARLWHPDHLSFTRNLIVASAGDVSPKKIANEDDPLASNTIAPFRDNYQLAVFRACRAAIKKAVKTDWTVPPAPRPQIYEIGRSGPTALLPGSANSPAEFSTLLTSFGTLGLALLDDGIGLGYKLALGALLIATLLWVGWDWFHFREGTDMGLVRLWKAEGKVVLIAVVGALFGVFFWMAAESFSRLPGGEPWAWTEGLSVWPTETIRLLIVFAVIATLVWSWNQYVKSRQTLLEEHFTKNLKATEEEDERLIGELNGQSDPDKAPGEKVRISAARVFREHIADAVWIWRALRVLVAAGLYLTFIYGVIIIMEGHVPDTPQVRGPFARWLDPKILSLSTSLYLALVYYVMDAVLLSARLLKKFTGAITQWPKELLIAYSHRFHVKADDLSGFLDVKFAAEKSKEVGKLVYLPFIIQFIFILSRNSYFDNWSWPRALTATFLANICLACAAWAILRRAARRLRVEAQQRLVSALDTAKFESENPSDESGQDDFALQQRKSAPATPHVIFDDAEQAKQMLQLNDPLVGQKGSDKKSAPCQPTPKERYLGLLILQRLINEEQRGAYAQFFQDPALIAMILPTGVFGILAVLFRALFGRS